MSKSGSTSNKNTLFCSFCGKSQHEVKKLIAGPTVFICDECVELCMDIIKEEVRTTEGKGAKSSVPAPKEIFDEGKKIYSYMCAHCHGEKGDGNGPMVTSGAYAGVPAYADRKDLSNGQIFYSIYYGKGAMGAHGPLINKKEIWTLVHYIRKFQDPEYGKKEPANAEQSISSDVDIIKDTLTVNNSM